MTNPSNISDDALLRHELALIGMEYAAVGKEREAATITRAIDRLRIMPTPEMTEAGARAIYDADPTLMFYERGPGSPPGNQFLDWEHAPQVCRDRARKQAVEAYTAMQSTLLKEGS